jgi:hypothetical protein
MMGQRIAFDVARHDAFQTLLDRWGDPNLLAAKRGRDLDPDSLVSNRHAQAARRVAEVQARYLRGETVDADTRTPPTMLDPALHGR